MRRVYVFIIATTVIVTVVVSRTVLLSITARVTVVIVWYAVEKTSILYIIATSLDCLANQFFSLVLIVPPDLRQESGDHSCLISEGNPARLIVFLVDSSGLRHQLVVLHSVTVFWLWRTAAQIF